MRAWLALTLSVQCLRKEFSGDLKMKGQLSIIGMIFLLVSLVIFVGLQPVLTALINTALPTADSLTQAVLRLMVPLVAIGILMAFLLYVLPQRQAPGF